MSTPPAALLPRRRTFRDVVVRPIESIHEGCMFRGGPVWPLYPLQFAARTGRGPLPFPRDGRPRRTDPPAGTLESATWIGPIFQHFGHCVADFWTRLAPSAAADPDGPLLFGMGLNARVPPPPFLWEILDHFGIDRARVVLLREPTLVRRLHVVPQPERRGGPRTGAAHLDLMDRLAPPPAGERIGLVYVSRARLRENRGILAGEIAGERYLEGLLRARGAQVMDPEALPLRAQLDLYARAERLVFSEGSAVHGLQLLGRLDTDVVVINRRRGARIAAGALRPRARSVTYVDALRGEVHGLGPKGRPDRVRGLCVLDPDRLLPALARAGIDLRGAWNEADHAAQRDADIAAWRAAVVARGLHPETDAAIRAGLARLGLPGGAAHPGPGGSSLR